MSMNPARTLASALPGGEFDHLWVYLLAPPLGMLLAAQVYVFAAGLARVGCAKLQHSDAYACIFCGHEPRRGHAEERRDESL
jgi:aquaporin Z